MSLNDKEKYHYNRHLILDEISEEGQEKLKSAKVLVIGAGGLGCPVLQYLTAAGVGKIGIVDFDNVDASNLQRQILFGYSSIGKNKAEESAARLTELNPFVKLVPYPIKLNYQNALDRVRDFDIIIDGTDNFETRYLVNDAAVLTGKPLVHGSIFKFEGQVSVFNYNHGPTYRCLFPDPPKPGSVPSCNEIGVLGVLPGIIGTFMANETLKIILGMEEILSGKLLVYKAKDNSVLKLNIKKNKESWKNFPASEKEFLEMSSENICDYESTIEINPEDLQSFIDKGIDIIDVREPFETPYVSEFETVKMPMSSIVSDLDKIDKEKEYVIMCQHGARSMQVVQHLRINMGHTKVVSLREGVAGLVYSGIVGEK